MLLLLLRRILLGHLLQLVRLVALSLTVILARLLWRMLLRCRLALFRREAAVTLVLVRDLLLFRSRNGRRQLAQLRFGHLTRMSHTLARHLAADGLRLRFEGLRFPGGGCGRLLCRRGLALGRRHSRPFNGGSFLQVGLGFPLLFAGIFLGHRSLLLTLLPLAEAFHEHLQPAFRKQKREETGTERTTASCDIRHYVRRNRVNRMVDMRA